MQTVDTTAIAAILGKTDNQQLEQQVNAAVSDLERKLGYSLCGTTDAEERLFPYTETLWHRTQPMYVAPTSITLVYGNSSEEVITDFQVGQNGKLFGDWFNAFRICDRCQVGRCYCYENCAYFKVVAKWGFAAPEASDESGDEQPLCVVPDDLYNVLLEAIKKAGDGKKDIQSESTGTRSYTKFASSYQTVWQKYADVINFYKLRKPRI